MKVEVFKKEKVVNTDATVVEYDNVIEETKDQVVTATGLSINEVLND